MSARATISLAATALLLALLVPTAPAPAQPDIPAQPRRAWNPEASEKPAPETAPKADTPPPRADDRGYDVLHYDLDLGIDPAAEAVTGRVGVSLAFLSGGSGRIVLDLTGNMTVDSVLWRGAAIEFAHLGDSLVVEAGPTGVAGEESDLAVFYHGEPQPHGLMNVGLMFRSHPGPTEDPADDAPVVFSIGEPWSSHSWWPCKDHPSDKATATIAVTAPEPLVGISNGVLVGTTSPAPGLTTTRWREDHPIATYLIAVSVSDYASWEETCDASFGEVPLTFHVFPQDEAAARADLARTCEMMNFLEGVCGPFPFADERYGHVEIVWAGAMEHQTATSISRFMLTGDGRYESTFLHEMAHSWFGDRMTPARWSDIWLNEGFARYCEALWVEREEGREAYLRAMREMGPERHPDLFADQGLLTDPDPILPNQMIYDKGAWVLHMLRGAVGDSAFFRFLKAYASAPAFADGNVTTADMLAIAGAETGCDVSGLLGPWLETSAVPEVEWWATTAPLAGGGARLILELRQIQPTVFTLPATLRATTAAGDVDLRLTAREPVETFRWDLDGDVLETELDPEGWLLMRAARVAPPATVLLPPRPNPAGVSGTTLSYLVSDGGPIGVSAYDARGRRVGSWDLGDHAAAAEPYTWIWQGADDRGRPLPSGVYWLVLSGGGQRSTRKVTLVR